ncbi:MAG: hypothetical protein AB1632_06710 [Nitrospirota bacterium]
MRRYVFGIVFIMTCFIAASSEAVMLGLSTDELTRSSDAVVTGKVEAVSSYWSSDGKTILTSVSVRVDRVVRGKTIGKIVVVEYEGGEVGDIGLKVSDMTEFSSGESVILFLKEGRSGKDGIVHKLVGKAQGVYKVDEKGIARKKGFSLKDGSEVIDNDIPVETLIDKIKRVR